MTANFSPLIDCDTKAHTFVQDPYATYRRWHAESPAFYWQQYDHWCFAGYDAVNGLLRDKRFGRQILHITDRQTLGWPDRPAHLAEFDAIERHSLLELEPPNHTKLRRLITKAFVSRQVETLRPQIRKTCHDAIDRFAESGSVELLRSYAMAVPLTTICNLLGVELSAGPQLLAWSHAIVKMYVLAPPLETQIAANKAAAEFAAFLTEQIDIKRTSPGDDLLSALIAVENQGDTLSVDELISTTVVLLNAGHEATVHQFGNAMRIFLTLNLDAPSLLGSPEACAATVEELIRYDAPLHMFTRYALSDMTLQIEGLSIELKLGDKIGLLLGAANRDPRTFDSPDEFLPHRDDQNNISFGAGIHFCIGAPLARIELQEMLSVLFERLPTIKLSTEPRFADIYHFHGLERLDVMW
ncbi:MAG: cytochrome P450 [Ahrensia sp.]